jgi:hypothetical protein
MRYSHLLFLIGLVSIGLLSSCKNDNDPETVVRTWQRHLDENKFDEAKALSTERAQQWLEIIEKMVTSDNQGADTFRTVFNRIDCKVVQDSAVCKYSVLEEGQEVIDSMFLKKVKGKWLVDIKLDDMPDENEVEDFLDDLHEDMPDSSAIQ